MWLRKRKSARKSRAAIVSRFATAILLAVAAAALLAAQQKASSSPSEATTYFDQGLAAYKAGQFANAAQQFQQASQLDPYLVNAQLYLAASYNAQFVPGTPSAENRQLGQEALQEYKLVATDNPTNLTAIDGAGFTLYNLSQSPFDAAGMTEAKAYWQRHVQVKSSDAEPHYWIGVIDWSIAYKANQDLRAQDVSDSGGDLAPAAALPDAVRARFSANYLASINEGMAQLQTAIASKPDYVDAMAYLNLLYRLKADAESNPRDREADLHIAEGLVSKVIETKNAPAAAGQNR